MMKMEKIFWDEIEVLERIGVGASGSVYKVKNKKTGELFALKEIRIHSKRYFNSVFSEHIPRFINHQNILKYSNLFVSNRPECIEKVINLGSYHEVSCSSECDSGDEFIPSDGVDQKYEVFYYVISKFCEFSLRDFIDCRNEIFFKHPSVIRENEIKKQERGFFEYLKNLFFWKKKPFVYKHFEESEKRINLKIPRFDFINETLPVKRQIVSNVSLQPYSFCERFEKMSVKSGSRFSKRSLYFNRASNILSIGDQVSIESSISFPSQEPEEFEDIRALTTDEKFSNICETLSFNEVSGIFVESIKDKKSNIFKIEDAFGHKRSVDKEFVVNSILVDGKDLNVDQSVAKNIMFHIVRGICHLHSKRIFHNDVNARNIFFTKRGKFIPKIGDFGLCSTQAGKNIEEDCKIDLKSNCKNYRFRKLCIKHELLEKGGDDVFNCGMTYFELLHPLQTKMERMYIMNKIKSSGTLPDFFIKKYPEETKIIEKVIKKKEKSRITSFELLKLILVLKL